MTRQNVSTSVAISNCVPPNLYTTACSTKQCTSVNKPSIRSLLQSLLTNSKQTSSKSQSKTAFALVCGSGSGMMPTNSVATPNGSSFASSAAIEKQRALSGLARALSGRKTPQLSQRRDPEDGECTADNSEDNVADGVELKSSASDLPDNVADVVEQMCSASDFPDLSNQDFPDSADEDDDEPMMPGAKTWFFGSGDDLHVKRQSTRNVSDAPTSSAILPSARKMFGSTEFSSFGNSITTTSPSTPVPTTVMIPAAQSVFGSTELFMKSQSIRPIRSSTSDGISMFSSRAFALPLAPKRRDTSAADEEINPFERSLAERFQMMDTAAASTRRFDAADKSAGHSSGTMSAVMVR
ncbi:hypothetical protein HKX48_000859 [Thoreauomyces humboldtii]|nr:hypothetical protein HKX48_000859 [Thoreauomyces humboldtii]